MDDYYGEEGCCLTCDAETKWLHRTYDDMCLCFECKCRKCDDYDPEDQECIIAFNEKEKWRKMYFEIGDVKAETSKAILVVIGNKDLWLPKSLSHIEKKNTKFCIVMPKWLAEEKGLIQRRF